MKLCIIAMVVQKQEILGAIQQILERRIVALSVIQLEVALDESSNKC